ncbi:MAG: hypothetical protein IPG17_03280 [Sandaracinaceae bacterium]|jgi:predicted PurR-regulated permease PerM|nr:hypothetical protein [Sandaracinaceae bacterium]MBP6774308.1 hypothetical protein [Gemmatimonadaceae bacterium]MBK6809765.1 hypothetical protein [Sandaracinaceae bacterium]MBK7155810.1 hypothetical protein [Sandaracinaceae bacterium]MBK7778414.1 hypothetical protein [Sandaracinaceae bacterium]
MSDVAKIVVQCVVGDLVMLLVVVLVDQAFLRYSRRPRLWKHAIPTVPFLMLMLMSIAGIGAGMLGMVLAPVAWMALIAIAQRLGLLVWKPMEE